ncbi:translesion error-prone DNA polymerase V autoproteolytic subunit [Castellaniella sp.]|uniref:LexA family protein n=1 Tax=Castellaniella sp. TaxID=1955812 RepID=UPI002AFE08B9|nr:translesion error-prone DNA polymerase V autoproteolytic subunit [Castellaniella sp.]
MSAPLPFQPNPAICWATVATTQCGFPSPADDHTQQRIDLNRILIHQPDATFYMRVRGPSMRDAGIEDGDYVIVDRSLEARHGDIVVAVVDSEFTVKTLHRKRGLVRLMAANPTFPNIELRDGQELVIWGVVTWTLKQNRA